MKALDVERGNETDGLLSSVGDEDLFFSGGQPNCGEPGGEGAAKNREAERVVHAIVEQRVLFLARQGEEFTWQAEGVGRVQPSYITSAGLGGSGSIDRRC